MTNKKLNQIGHGISLSAIASMVALSYLGLSDAGIVVTVLLFWVGLGMLAKSKGYPWFYCLLGFFSIFGYIILSVIEDKNKQ